MANIESQIVNFYESTLATLLASGATSTTVATAPTTNGTSVINASAGSPIYLVLDPDNSGNREVISVTSSSGTTLSTITRDLENRYSGTPPDHQIGTTIRLAVLAEHFEDMNDRLDAGLASLANAIETTDLGNGLQWTGSVAEVDINGATDGTAITVDGANDLLLLYDADAGVVKKVKSNQVGGGGISSGRALTLG